jgi:serine/threonine-protein kinase
VQFTSTGGTVPNAVISQSPPGGTHGHTGDQVILVVLNPNSQYPVPDVTGQSPTSAAGNLGAAGLIVASSSTSKCANTVASGLVVATSPGAGSLVSAGATVQLIVSAGVCNVIVPSVIGMTQVNATAAMTGQGLQVNYVTGDSATCVGQSDWVASQDLSGGSTAPYHTVVNLTYCPPTG